MGNQHSGLFKKATLSSRRATTGHPESATTNVQAVAPTVHSTSAPNSSWNLANLGIKKVSSKLSFRSWRKTQQSAEDEERKNESMRKSAESGPRPGTRLFSLSSTASSSSDDHHPPNIHLEQAPSERFSISSSDSSDSETDELDSMAPSTVPCQYRTGKTLGSGTYAIVKEAIHIKTNKYYACKVINKKLMEGREYMVRNEIAVLKRISSGNRNIVTLHDYFETAHNLYLCFDLCTGGELFDRICAKGNYYEGDAADLVRTIMKAVAYIHSAGIVHRDLKPENLLFRTPAEDADIMIADFGLSRIMEEEKLSLLTEICGTPGYMAPEIFKKTGHGKPVDIWAMGVITYFLLAGYTPFDRDSQQAEMEAIIAGDYKFEPEEYWVNVSETARDFVRECLTIDPANRPTAEEALRHKWLADSTPHFVPDPQSPTGGPTDLLPHVKKAFNAKKLWRKAAFSIRALNRMSSLAAGHGDDAEKQLQEDVKKYKEESERERMEESSIMHHHNEGQPPSPDSPTYPRKEQLKKVDDLSVDNGESLENNFAKAHLDEKDRKERNRA